MIDWNIGYNWTHDEFTKVVDNSLVKQNKKSICLDTEHVDFHNEEQIIAWAKERGYKAERLSGGDKIRVYK